MFTLRASESYEKSVKKLVGKNEQLKKRIKSTLQKLRTDPTYVSLNSHRVNTSSFGVRWSSWVTGDIRIIWDYHEGEKPVIILLDIGKHSGTHKVYQ